MPLLRLHTNYEFGEAAADIARGLSELTAQILRKDPAKIVVHLITDNRQACWYVNGASAPAPPSIMDLSILVTKGTNSDREKSQWIDATWRLLSEKIGPLHGPNYISVIEIEAMNWGYNGVTQYQRSQELRMPKEPV